MPEAFWFRSARAAEAILGYRPEEMIGRSGDRLHPSRRSREVPRGNARGAARTARRRFPIRAAFTRTGATCALSWLGTWSEPVKRYFFVGRDMTESRLAQETLRESEQLARGIIDTALDAFVQIDEQRHHPGLEFAGRKRSSAGRATRRSARTSFELIVPAGAATAQDGPASASCAPATGRSSAAAAKSRSGGATARSSRSN